MGLKDKTRQELEQRVKEIDNIIAQKGVGSRQLGRAVRVQRNLNLALLLGTVAVVIGLTSWLVSRSGEEDY